VDTLFNSTAVKNIPGVKRAKKDFALFPHPERTLEWLGGVTYANLENTLGNIKELMRKNPQEEIHLLVSSFGGATGIGMSFYDAVKTWLRPKLYTLGSGDVDSSGIIVFLAGEKRFLTPNTTMLLHLGGRTFDRDKRFSTLDMENMLKEDRLKDMQYAGVISDATGGRYSPDKILKLMAKNTILSAEEAVNMGLAHKILRAES
jgi:ATP-dependent Clp protease, protease subunit